MSQYPLMVCCHRLGISLFTLRQWCERAGIDLSQQRSVTDPRQKWLTDEQLLSLARTHGRLLDQPPSAPEAIPPQAYKLLVGQVAAAQGVLDEVREEIREHEEVHTGQIATLGKQTETLRATLGTLTATLTQMQAALEKQDTAVRRELTLLRDQMQALIHNVLAVEQVGAMLSQASNEQAHLIQEMQDTLDQVQRIHDLANQLTQVEREQAQQAHDGAALTERTEKMEVRMRQIATRAEAMHHLVLGLQSSADMQAQEIGTLRSQLQAERKAREAEHEQLSALAAQVRELRAMT